MRGWRIALLCAAGALAACRLERPAFPDGRLVDLTHAFDADTIYWPSEQGFELERGVEGVTPQGWWYAAHRFRTAEHGGTHIDAPIHFAQAGASVDQVPLERLMAAAVLVDARDACARDRDHQIGPEELLAWERGHGPIPSGAIVLLQTGFGRLWPDRAAYLGTDERGAAAVALLHSPGHTPTPRVGSSGSGGSLPLGSIPRASTLASLRASRATVCCPRPVSRSSRISPISRLCPREGSSWWRYR